MTVGSKLTAALAGCIGALLAGSVTAAEITVISTPGPMPDVMGALVPMFESASGHRVKISFKPAPAAIADLKQGGVDLLIAGTEAIDDLAKEGVIAANGKTSLMISRVGVAVRAGAAKPDISTPEKLKAVLLAAKTVGYSQGASGQHFLTVIQKLGIADAVKAKAVIAQGELVGAVVARGAAEIGVQQLAELLAVPGVDLVGPMPGDLQKQIPYSAGISAKAKDADTARALVKFLSSETAVTVLKRKGMEPVI
jgi:molybdate transport system substrate-binding protein